MQLPTHLITAVMIDKLVEKSGLPAPSASWSWQVPATYHMASWIN